jgi:signal transduction histidine kinase
LIVGNADATADLVIHNEKGYITIRPADYKTGNLMNQMISDMGQLMKEPLNNLYNAIDDLGNPEKKDNAVAVIRHSFYNLVRLSENQIAVSSTSDSVHLIPFPIVSFVQDAIASVNETLEDRGITVELDAEPTERICNIHPQKLTHLLMILISSAARNNETVTVTVQFTDDNCNIKIPVSSGTISLYDSSSYLTAAGTPKSLDSLENLTLAKIINTFNEAHKSRVFTDSSSNTVIISIATEKGGVVGEIQPVQPGLRPDLIFLSDILSKDSYK